MIAFSEVRQTLRRLWKNLGFSSSVVLTLGLGVGATVSVFSIIYAVMIVPLPYVDPGRLASIFQSKIANDEANLDGFSPADFLDFRQREQVFTDVAATCGFYYTLTGHGEPRHLNGTATSSSLFSILGARPMLGRTFLPEEDSFTAPHVVLLSHRLWAANFHADPQIVGRTISLSGGSYYVVGVMPKDFDSPGDDWDSDLWIPLQQQIRPDRMMWRDQHFLQVVGRLRPGVSLDQARADMNRIAGQLHLQYPASGNGSGAVVMALQRALVGETRRSLLLAFGIVGLVLLVASANVAILMLARVTGRTRELAVRMALGASTYRILRDVLAESLILGVLSGFLGLLVALAGRKLFLFLAPYDEHLEMIQINPAVIAFAIGVSVIVGLGFGLLPALRVFGTDIQQGLRNAGNTSTRDAGGRFVRNALIVGEISISVVLLVATGLLVRSMVNLRHKPLGFRSERVVASWIGLPRILYQNNEDVARFFSRVDQNLRALPGVEAAGLGYPLPFTRNGFWTNFTISGRSAVPGEYEVADLHYIDSGFLPVMSIPILDGRNFSDADDAKAQPVAIVSESFAHEYWPGDSAIGKYISIHRDSNVAPRRIVGVVGDVRGVIAEEPPPTMYVSYKQTPFQSMQIVLRCQVGSNCGVAEVRQAVQSVDPEQPVEDVYTVQSFVNDALNPWKFALSLLGGLAVLAAVLTAVGLFAVVSYLVRERTKELGLRMAIGASRNSVVNLILTQSLKLAAMGAAIGLVCTFIITRLMTEMVYGIRPNDPEIFCAVAFAVGVISVVAAYVPARRASRIEPLAALREE